VVPCGLALATSQPWAQHNTGPGYSQCRQFIALAWRAIPGPPAAAGRPLPRLPGAASWKDKNIRPGPVRPSDRRPIPRLAAPRRIRMVNLRPAPMLSKTMTERTHSAIWSRFEDTEESQVPPKRPGVLDQRAENTFNGTPQHALTSCSMKRSALPPRAWRLTGLRTVPLSNPRHRGHTIIRRVQWNSRNPPNGTICT